MLRAVLTRRYLRTSTDDISMKIQRERLLALAEREGYEIVQWYTDDCCLGIKPVQRHEWLALLADAVTAAWTVILCLNRTRFGRLNGVENGMAIQKLKEAGKKIHTAIEGLVDWDATACEIIDQMIDAEEGVTSPIVVDAGEKAAVDSTASMGRLMDVFNTEMHHYHVEQLARRSLEGQLRAFQQGRRIFGTCPYGYACVLTDPRGTTQRLSRNENCSVPKGWTSLLVPGDPEEIEVVRRLKARLNTWNLRFQGLGKPVSNFSNSVASAPAFFNWLSIAPGGRPEPWGIPPFSDGWLSPAA